MSFVAHATVLIYFITTTFSQFTCNKEYQCVGDELNAPSVTLNIDGYKAATGATTSFFSDDPNNKILCRAAHSCDSMSSMITPAVNCKGTYSCANVSIQAGLAGEALDSFCYALNSCRFANITMVPNAVGNLWCNGEQSCAESTIYAINKLHASGAYALYFANIYSHVQNPNITTTVTLRISGKLAAYGATFTCLAGHVCKIWCDGRDSCSMFQINGPGDYTIKLATANTTAPNTTDINPPSLDIDPIDTEEMCNTHGMTLLANDKNKYNTVPIVVQNETHGPVCCRGLGACSYTNITIDTSQSLLCSAGFSCRHSNIMMNNGSVYCEAGCYSADIYNASDLHCFEYQSCMLSNIRSTKYVSCSGKSSCQDAVIHSDGTDLDVSFTANEAGKGTVIYCDVDDVCSVECGAMRACENTMLYCYGSCTVTCDVESYCPEEVTLNPTVTTYEPTGSPTPAPSNVPTISPSDNPSAAPSKQPTKSPSNNPTLNPSKDPTLSPSEYPSGSPTKNPTAYPSISPTGNPTNYPSTSPTRDPSTSPTRDPSASPTRDPSVSPTPEPSQSPTRTPTVPPSDHPSASPVATASPTGVPSRSPTNYPSMAPVVTSHPSVPPTESPTDVPTVPPSNVPSEHPSTSPTDYPSVSPIATASPTLYPSTSPTRNPSTTPSREPSVSPTRDPSASPTNDPSMAPVVTSHPSVPPSNVPSEYPTTSPTEYPSVSPIATASPSKYPSLSPSDDPTASPSNYPSVSPTEYPSKYPTVNPTKYPSKFPSKYPTDNPSNMPSNEVTTPIITAPQLEFTISITLTACDENCVITEDKINNMLIAQLDPGVAILSTEIVDNTVVVSIVADATNELDKDVIAAGLEAEYGEAEVVIEENEDQQGDEDEHKIDKNNGLTSALFLWSPVAFGLLATTVLICILCRCRYLKKRKSSQKHTNMMAMEKKQDGVTLPPGATNTVGGTTCGDFVHECATERATQYELGEESVSASAAEEIHTDDVQPAVDADDATKYDVEDDSRESDDNDSMYEHVDNEHEVQTPQTPGDAPMTAGYSTAGARPNDVVLVTPRDARPMTTKYIEAGGDYVDDEKQAKKQESDDDNESMYDPGDENNEPMTSGNTTTGGEENANATAGGK